MAYTNLHQHSKYSVLDGLGEVEDIVKKYKELGMKGVCITDHGMAACWYELYDSCKKHGMKPIFGNEIYFTPNGLSVKEKVEGWKAYYHLILIAQNDVGFKNLMKLTSISWIDGKYYRPRIDYSALKKYNEGIIVLQACLGGLLAQLVMENRLEEAEDHLIKFKQILGDRYYLECQYTGIKEQELVNQKFKELAKKHNVHYVITADSHYINKNQSDYHAALVSINTGGKFKKPVAEGTDQDETGLYYTPRQYYIKSQEELEEYFNSEEDQLSFALSNEIADRCNVNFNAFGDYLPKVAPTNEEERDILESKCIEALNKLHGLSGSHDNEEWFKYKERLDFEIGVIYRMGYCGYFLIVADYINWANENNVVTGPGRGSAAGALVAYLMGITKVDPIKYHLLFERFLNRGRAKLPLIEFKEFPIADWQKLKKESPF